MDVGMIGLGRMGANMAERLRRRSHHVVGFDQHVALVPPGAPVIDRASSLAALVDLLVPPRSIWLMLPAASGMAWIND